LEENVILLQAMPSVALPLSNKT